MIIIPLSHELRLWWRTLIAACGTLASFHPCSSFGDRYVVLKRRHVFCCNTDSNPSPVRVEPVSVSTGKSCRENVCRGQRLRRHFRRHQSTARDRDRAFPRLRLRSHGKLKPIPTAARKRLLCKTAWWARQDSNLQPSGYEPLALTIELRAPAAFLATGEPKGQSFAPAGVAPPARSRGRANSARSNSARILPTHSPKPATLLSLRISAVRHVVGYLPTRVAPMLPNFTIVICGAILTVMMLAVTGSGLVTPETRTRIGETPEIGRPMVQRMIPEQAGQAQFAALDLSRRAEEIGRLRDLAPPALVFEPAPAAWNGNLARAGQR